MGYFKGFQSKPSNQRRAMLWRQRAVLRDVPRTVPNLNRSSPFSPRLVSNPRYRNEAMKERTLQRRYAHSLVEDQVLRGLHQRLPSDVVSNIVDYTGWFDYNDEKEDK